MKKIFVLVTALSLITCVQAITDIEFSPGGISPGGWSYQGTSAAGGVFSFSQDVDIDAVLGLQTDILYDEFVYLPDLTLSNYVPGAVPGIGSGDIATGGIVEIKDGSGTLLLSGTLVEGNYYATFATSQIYPEVVADITVTYVHHLWGSAYLNGISVDDLYDLNLSLQAFENFETMITSAGTGSNGFSGSMTIIPEPATLALLGLGGLLLRRKK